MAVLEKKGVNPVVAAIGNYFWCIIGYILLGQTGKGIKTLICGLIGSCLCVLPGILVCILSMVDGYQVAKAVEEGEEIDEMEFKNEMLCKIVRIIDKNAFCKTLEGGDTPGEAAEEAPAEETAAAEEAPAEAAEEEKSEEA